MSALPDFTESPPDRGNPDTIRALASAFGVAHSGGEESANRVRAAESSLALTTADSTAAVQAKLAALRPQYSTFAGSAQGAQQALNTYANGLQALRDTATRLRTEGQQAYDRLQSVRSRAMNTLWDQLVGVFVPWDGVPWQVLRTYSPAVGNSWQAAIDDYKRVAQQYNGLWAERLRLDRDVKAALALLPLAKELRASDASGVSFAALLARSKAWAGDASSLTASGFKDIGDPRAVNAAWSQLSRAEQLKLLRDHPEVFGNMQGIPYADRAIANKLTLDRLLEDGSISAETRAKLTEINKALKGDSDAKLISFELEGEEPRAAIAVGDLDNADSVSYMVHGIKTDTSGIGDWVRSAADFRSTLTTRGVTAKTAFVAWFRYDSGNEWTVSSHDLATAGAKKLGADLEGLAAVNPNAERILFGYSYGTTVVGETVRTHPEYIDGIHFNGSAGLTPEARAAVEQGVASDKFFATATHASKDGIAPLGRSIFSSHQENPGDFAGVKTLGADGGDVGGEYGEQVDGHDAHKGEPFKELDSIVNYGDSKRLAEKTAELDRRGIEYEVRTVVMGRNVYTGVYTTSTGYLTPNSQSFLETVREYENRLK